MGGLPYKKNRLEMVSGRLIHIIMLDMCKIGIVVIFSLLSTLVEAREVELFRRVTVFPLKVENELIDVAEKAWWEVRKQLTADKRFLVATKSFLQKKDAFQAREELRPSDVIILGRLLDAHVLVSMALSDRVLKLRAYEGENGQVVWQGEIKMHPSLPASEQLVKVSVQLLKDFISSWPYQGFVIEDRFVGDVVFEEGNKRLAKVRVGSNAANKPGDPVEFIRLQAESLRPLFSGGAKEIVVGEGRVLYVDNELVTVEIERFAEDEKLQVGSLVKFPKEYQRLRDLFSMDKSHLPTVSARTTSEKLSPRDKESEEKKSLVTSLAFLGSLALFLILAF